MFVALLLFDRTLRDLPFPLSETSGGQGPTGEATKLQLTRLAVKDLPMLGLSKMVPQNKTWIFFHVRSMRMTGMLLQNSWKSKAWMKLEVND